ncbi:MAG: DNA-binding protein [Candidatus Theseobacter exili]|nr:DNA-binding protein [Candidatus Theseobacter exili]
MKYSESQLGRIFVIRLEDGDIIHEEIENLAKQNNIESAALIILGGADKNSKLVVGPQKGREKTIIPMEHILNNVHEITGTGTLFLDDANNSILHMHISCGRNDNSVTGCVRRGVKAWHVMEIVLFELTGSPAKRILDPATGFKLLDPCLGN